MKNKLKSVKRGSRTAAASQPKTAPKTAQSRGLVRPASALPCIALFPEGYDETSGGISSEIVDLSQAESAAPRRAGAAAPAFSCSWPTQLWRSSGWFLPVL